MSPLRRFLLVAVVVLAAVLAPTAAGQASFTGPRTTTALASASFDGLAPRAYPAETPRRRISAAPTGLGTAPMDDGPGRTRGLAYAGGAPARAVAPRLPGRAAPARVPLSLHYTGPADASTDGLSLDFARDRGLLAPARSVEHRLRGYTEKHRRWLAPALAGAAVVTQGWLHGTFYSMDVENGVYDTEDLHAAAYIHASTVWALSYVAGADPVDAYGVAVIADVVFNGFINLGFDQPFFDDGETTCWPMWGGVCVPKPITGQARLYQVGIGAAMILGPRLIRRFFF